MKSLIIITLLLTTPMEVTAGIVVSPIILYINKNKQTFGDIVVQNESSTANAYVKVSAQWQQHPGTKHSKDVFYKNPKKFGLLVSPSKMIIPPKHHKIIRIISISPMSNKERIYNVSIMPIINDLDTKQHIRAQVKFLVGYKARVIILPKDPTYHVTLNRHHHTLIAKNTGNTNVLLHEGKQCTSTHKSCKTLPTQRLYAGNTWRIKLAYAKPVTFQMLVNDSINKTIKSN